MAQKIYWENATKKDRPVLPPGMRYAVFCKRAQEKEPRFECETKENDGLIGYYGDAKTAEETGESHSHAVLIRYYNIHQADHYDF